MQIFKNPSVFSVTIVIAVYNRAATVRRALDSIAAQDYPHIETIVIDGASTDGTLEILREYEARGIITKLVSEPDHGIYEAMNKGVRLATGDIIGFLGSDDVYLDGAISAIVQGFQDSHADVVYGDSWFLFPGGVKRYRDHGKRNLDDHLYWNQLNHQSLFVRTSLQKEHPFDTSYRISGDYKFLSMLYFSGYKFHHIPIPIADYSAGGLSAMSPWHICKESERVIRELVARFPALLQNREKMERAKRWRRAGVLQVFLLERCGETATPVPFVHIDRKIIVFGTGVVGEKFVDMMAFNETPDIITGFWDNNKNAQDTQFCNRLVTLPHAGVQDACILIASSRYEDEMAAQLDGLGYVRGRDYLTWSDAIEGLAALYARRRWHYGVDAPCTLEGMR